MLSLRNFWRRHRRKILVTAGVVGGGYFLYKLYSDYGRRVADLEKQLERQRINDELIKAQLQAHFENVQRIAETATLPHAIHYLSSRIEEELNLSNLTERLLQGKGQPNTLSSSEKLELWERLKILSFTRMVVSLWAVTMLSLYVRIQVNILGRHIYIDTARGLGSSYSLEDADFIDRDSEQNFLASADFLASSGVPLFISNMQAVVAEVLKEKQLRDVINTTGLHETVSQILDIFMSAGSPHHWIEYLMPEDARFSKLAKTPSNDDTVPSDLTKFDQLMTETRDVLSSAEFGDIVEISLKAVVGALMEDIAVQSGDSLTSGMPLARLLPRVIQVAPSLVDEPRKSRFIQIIQTVPDVELFFTLLYANAPNP
ncbi:Peroxisome biogenesis 3-2 -like protein [Tripterygium wilfordii]|uniref:Peroxisome biogenesis 3-2 -like protein n=1 Tax=Tripterygium wilfordii TaxID=458696 RepID=A0A7J7C8Z6_TRIWF|nr:peroxisome biogenesis protein 3-1-like [Tripterygium wilfordii]KAF5730327.1 Peroxisome biogenesis 3-2 -like protein [Tripterygium wilfordii]